MKRWLMVVLLALAGTGWHGLHAGEARPLAENELTEKRLIAISSELRCLVCQNESLAGSQRRTGQRPAPRDPHADQGRQERR
ncbi:MAG: cytochrome c-type biogenesis protein CcmH [Candidatus Accumulibacter propinquus]|jgi:cytochrome c-type biogenesis protein CcmH